MGGVVCHWGRAIAATCRGDLGFNLSSSAAISIRNGAIKKIQKEVILNTDLGGGLIYLDLVFIFYFSVLFQPTCRKSDETL